MIRVTVNNRKATAIPLSPVTSGAVGIPVEFIFSDDWEDLAITAVFRGSDTERDVIVIENACTVPAEVVASSGELLWVGVYGSNGQGTVVIPTIWTPVGRIEPGTEPSEMDPSEPTPSWAAQVQTAAADALVIAQSVRDDADSGEFDGATGPQGPQGEKGDKGDPGGVTEEALAAGLAGKVDKETGKGLSSNDFTDTYKNKIGAAALNTTASNLSGAVNELAGQFPVSIPQGGTGQTDVSTESTVSNVISAGSGFSIENVTYKQWGKVAQLYIQAKKSAAQTSEASMTVGTVVSGKCPAVLSGATCTDVSIAYCYVATSGIVSARGTWAAGATKTIVSTYILPSN